jgi:hypothetical protein
MQNGLDLGGMGKFFHEFDQRLGGTELGFGDLSSEAAAIEHNV